MTLEASEASISNQLNRRWLLGAAVPAFTAIGTVAFAVLILSIVMTRAPLLGYRTVIITGGSMEPAIETGSLLLSQRAEPETLETGDVITFRYPASKTTITHRIYAVRQEGAARLFETKGDANQTADPDEITFDTGRAYKMKLALPYAGYLLAIIGSPAGIAIIVGVALSSLAATEILDGWRQRRRVHETPPEAC